MIKLQNLFYTEAAFMIDRYALISRHNPRYTRAETEAPLSVGNGTFCFTADVTGLQSLTGLYTRCPLCTLAEWGWHRYPDAPKDDRALRLESFDTYGRPVGYATSHEGQEELFYALRQSAHKVNLAQIGFRLDGANLSDCESIDQTLDLWRGVLTSSFRTAGQPVLTETLALPGSDALCVRVTSPLLADGRLCVSLAFPYGSHKMSGGDFSLPERHRTLLSEQEPGYLRLSRVMDDFRCEADVRTGAGVRTAFDGAHGVTVTAEGDTLEMTVRFAPVSRPEKPALFAEGLAACAAFWAAYWTEGAAVELARSRDPRGVELERRIVLSQYVTAIQSRGALPPAETGLTINSWYGKFNVEMHFWHTAHFPLWNRRGTLERSLNWYREVLPTARDIARSQGYEGARWPKLCDGSGYNSPSSIAVLLIWQQPHPILLAELCRRQNPSPDFLRAYRDVVVESAEFMCSFAHWDGGRYVLGAPYIPSQERFDPRTVLNAGFEVEYFRWALRRANDWLKALGEPENPRFAAVADKLADPAVFDGVYPAHENCPETYVQAPYNTDHPSMVAMLGVLPGERVSREVMAATLDRILTDWDLASTWGWDFPMLAMTAARLGRRGQAVDFLLMDAPKNRYLPNGHNMQGDKEDLPLYLPGNAALLLAVALMAGGWDGDGGGCAPGFPDDGGFTVEAENLHRYI
jgi:hypothetical protein